MALEPITPNPVPGHGYEERYLLRSDHQPLFAILAVEGNRIRLNLWEKVCAIARECARIKHHVPTESWKLLDTPLIEELVLTTHVIKVKFIDKQNIHQGYSIDSYNVVKSEY